ncbi:MAG: hypothetical protein IPO25_07775 [Saprospiraceae bacterium]|nr:hypothetical protein [Saprospiraceae bacterium]
MNKKSDSNVAVEAREIFMPDWPGDIHSLNAANKVQPQITCSKSTPELILALHLSSFLPS